MTNGQADEGNGSSTIHSFIVQIYIDEMEEMPYPTIRFGHITHLPDGERHYIKGLNEITEFIQAHLKLNGVS